MKVIQINASYKSGSTGRNVYEMHQWFKSKGIESYVFWATKNGASEQDGHVLRVGHVLDHKVQALLTRLCGDYGYGSVLATVHLCDKIRSISPDVVHLHNLHSNYVNMRLLLSYLQKNRIPTVITLHDCWFFTGGCMHFDAYHCREWRSGCLRCPMREAQWRGLMPAHRILENKRRSLSGIDAFGVIGVSSWIKNMAEDSVLSGARCFDYIYNWVDLKIFSPKVHSQMPKNKKTAICVSNSWGSAHKGLKDILYIAKRLSDVQFIVIGRGTENFRSYNNIRYIPFTSDANELAEYYSSADVFVNPSRMETFGKVTAEALACGVPAVVYANTGTQELVSQNCGRIGKDGDVEEMISNIQEVLSKGKAFYTNACRKHAEECFSIEEAGEKHLRFYNNVIQLRK